MTITDDLAKYNLPASWASWATSVTVEVANQCRDTMVVNRPEPPDFCMMRAYEYVEELDDVFGREMSPEEKELETLTYEVSLARWLLEHGDVETAIVPVAPESYRWTACVEGPGRRVFLAVTSKGGIPRSWHVVRVEH